MLQINHIRAIGELDAKALRHHTAVVKQPAAFDPRSSGVIRVEDLRRLGVLGGQVRRDLDQLERGGSSGALHGAPCSVKPLEEPVFEDKTSLAVRRSGAQIAEAALTSIDRRRNLPGWGRRGAGVGAAAPERTNLTVVTNSLHAAHELAGRGPRLIVIGGTAPRPTLVGPLTRLVLDGLHLDERQPVRLQEGLTTTNPTRPSPSNW